MPPVKNENLNLAIDRKVLFKNDSEDDSHIVRVTLSDETPVNRFSWDGQSYDLILSHQADAVDMTRMDILPMFWNHNDYDLPLGSYKNGTLQNLSLEADAVFDVEDESALKILKKVKAGHIQTVSVGVTIFEKTIFEAEDGKITVTATKWQPYECSFTANPANPNARVKLSQDKGDAINLKIQGEDMNIEKVLLFLSTATADEKNEITKNLGTDTEVATLSNQVKELEEKLSNTAVDTTILAKTNESLQEITEMVTSATFSKVSDQKKKEAIACIKLSNTGEFNKLEFENILLKHAMASKAPSAGESNTDNNADEMKNQNLKMAGSL